MAYGTPADPVSGTVITVTYAVSNLLNPIRQLRSNTGGSEPPGSDYVVVSDGPGGPTSWRKVPFSALVETPWAASNDGVGSNLDADLWRGLTPATMTVGAATFASTAGVAGTANNSTALGSIAASGYALALQALSATQGAAYGLTTSYAAVPGVSITIPVLATWMVIAHSQGTFASTDGAATARLHVAASPIGPEPTYALAENGRRSVGITWVGPISAGAVLDLRAKKASGSGGSSVDVSDIVAIRVA